MTDAELLRNHIAELERENLAILRAVHKAYPDFMNDGLLPCPCCGGKAAFCRVSNEDSEYAGGHYIECTNKTCGLTTPLMYPCGDDPLPQLAERWNRRVTS